MDQNILPKRIKIVANLMIISGVLIFCEFVYTLWAMFSHINFAEYNIISFILANLLLNDTLLVAILFILFAYFLKKKKKWAWFAAVVLLLRETVGGIYSLFSYFPNLSTLIAQWKMFQEIIPIPLYIFIALQIISIVVFVFVSLSLIFLILDRKKYWQIAS